MHIRLFGKLILMLQDRIALKMLKIKNVINYQPLRIMLKKTKNVQQIYKQAISIHQSTNSKSGYILENVIAKIFDNLEIKYLRQACIDKNGIITPPTKGLHRYDFIINASIGSIACDHYIISCKKSLRERYLQDANVICKKLFMITQEKVDNAKRSLIRENHNISIMTIGGPKQFNLTSLISEISA